MDKFQTLEERIAHLTRAVEELSDVVTRQDAELRRLSRRVGLLMEREATREAADGAPAPSVLLVVQAMDTAGKAVLLSGATVLISLSASWIVAVLFSPLSDRVQPAATRVRSIRVSPGAWAVTRTSAAARAGWR